MNNNDYELVGGAGLSAAKGGNLLLQRMMPIFPLCDIECAEQVALRRVGGLAMISGLQAKEWASYGI